MIRRSVTTSLHSPAMNAALALIRVVNRVLAMVLDELMAGHAPEGRERDEFWAELDTTAEMLSQVKELG